VPFGDVGVEVGALDEAEEELVDDLEVRPRELEDRLVFLWVEKVAYGVYGRGDGAEEVGGKLAGRSRDTEGDRQQKRTHHADHLWIYGLGDHPALSGDVFEHLMQGLGLDLLSPELRAGVVKVEEDATLLELLDEQLVPLTGRSFWKRIR
jgi:hypothetical protein